VGTRHPSEWLAPDRMTCYTTPLLAKLRVHQLSDVSNNAIMDVRHDVDVQRKTTHVYYYYEMMAVDEALKSHLFSKDVLVKDRGQVEV
jgi:hypothetical protein